MAVSKIWRNIDEHYNLVGNFCSICNSYYFPGRIVCLDCGNIDMTSFKFKGKGKIVTFTIVRTPVSDPEGESNEHAFRKIPYILAIIELEEGPNLTCEIVDTEIEYVEIGNIVEVVFRKILEKGEKGVIQYGYKFKQIT